MAKQADYVRYTIRVPADLYERIKDAAGEKSINAEIVARLEDSFGEDGKPSEAVKRLELMVALQREALANQKKLMEEWRWQKAQYPNAFKEIEYLRRANSLIALIVRGIARETNNPTLSRLTSILDNQIIEGQRADVASMKQSALGLIAFLDETNPPPTSPTPP